MGRLKIDFGVQSRHTSRSIFRLCHMKACDPMALTAKKKPNQNQSLFFAHWPKNKSSIIIVLLSTAQYCMSGLNYKASTVKCHPLSPSHSLIHRK